MVSIVLDSTAVLCRPILAF